LAPFTTGLEIFAINLMIRADIIRSRQTRSRVWRILIVSGFLLLFYSNVRADTEQGKRLYRENCAPCHGESGKGDGVGSQSLPVRPADHTNGAAMKSRTDAFLRDVIAKGGSAMRLSSFMPAWKGILKDSEIQDLHPQPRVTAQMIVRQCGSTGLPIHDRPDQRVLETLAKQSPKAEEFCYVRIDRRYRVGHD
jgi:hypothetical protein